MTKTTRDYSATLFLPQTDFPMRAGLPEKEPELLARWERLNLFQRLRRAAEGRTKFVLHDGPPYANGNIHIGHALNKILKDVVTRSQQMLGYDSNYVPGWDCHGLPIEWKIEEEYRSKGKNKDAVPIVEFRQECRAFAQKWIDIQREEFKRLGVEGDWEHPYTTMAYQAEAVIAQELLKFAANGLLYRGSKPVMWSVVEKTALAEAEVEYDDYTSDTVWVKFPVNTSHAMADFDSSQGVKYRPMVLLPDSTSIVIWTTTPWTIPGNRAISFSSRIPYALYKVTDSAPDNWAKFGDLLIIAENLAGEVFKQARVMAYDKVADVPATLLAELTCRHPLHGKGYDFAVPLLDGDHVTDDAGTGFVHTAPGHGREDFDIWTANARALEAEGISTAIPYTVDENGAFTSHAPGFEGKRVITDKGEKGDANGAVMEALIAAGNLLARGRLKHQYPHSWRSKKPVIFRNTPQWFIAMDKPIADGAVASPLAWEAGAKRREGGTSSSAAALANTPLPTPPPQGGREQLGAGNEDTLRNRALAAIKDTRWVPPSGQNRITGMIMSKPDWVLSRQRAWGVPITVFIREKGDGSVDILEDEGINNRIIEAFASEGADAWYEDGARERFLGERASEGWQKVDDILDVWFDSGSTHAFVLEDAQNFPTLAGIRRKQDGGDDIVMYLEGSDQHRGWFHSSLLESSGTRGGAPYDAVLTHGFVLDESGRKMSKSFGNVTAPQDVIKQSGADILRMWVCASDYADDLRIGPEILKTTVETYRKLRNTTRWMLGNLAHLREEDRVEAAAMPELERLMLHRLVEIDAVVRQAYADFDYKRIFATLSTFMTVDLSAFYFDIRKDALYCDPISSATRKACLTVLDELFRCTVTWLAPMLCFTCEEAWLARYSGDEGSVHLETFPDVPVAWRDDALSHRWAVVRQVRRVVTGALEVERAQKRIGSSLEAAPDILIGAPRISTAVEGVDFAEVCITSDARVSTTYGQIPEGAFSLPDVSDVWVVPHRAEGTKCARSWKISPDVGSHPDYPDVTPRDAQALREWDAVAKAAE